MYDFLVIHKKLVYVMKKSIGAGWVKLASCESEHAARMIVEKLNDN